MIHATSESDITSLTNSSPRSSPKPPAYYVQSPSRDSHEDATSATATRSTGYRSPTSGSPSSSLLSLFSRHSPGSGFRRKGRGVRVRGRLLGHVTEGEEEDEVEEEREFYVNWWRDEEREELSGSCKMLMVVMGLGLLFLVSCLFVWGATRSFTPQIFLQKMSVNNMYIGEGTDQTGVPSKMLTIRSTVKMSIHNSATFFGIHVSLSPINLKYYDLTLASTQIEEYYQPKKSWKTIAINIQGSKVPLYGAGDGFILAKKNSNGVPLKLDFEITTQGNVVGKLVKSKRRRHIQCSFSISSQVVHFTKKSCVFI